MRNGCVICYIDIDFVLIVLIVLLLIGEIVVFDVESRCVYVYIFIGDYYKQFDIKYGDFREIVYIKNNDIVVLNQEKNRFLYFDKDGVFIYKFVQVLNVFVRFQKMVMGGDGYYVFIFSSEVFGFGVVVYDVERCYKMVFIFDYFKGNNLVVIYYKDKFYVVDCISIIKIFDNKGKFFQEIKSLGGKIIKFLLLVVDFLRENLVCVFENIIFVIKIDGNVVIFFFMGGYLNVIVVFKGCNSLVVCFYEKKFF